MTDFAPDITRPKCFITMRTQVEKLAAYLRKTNGVYPNKRSLDEEEHEMGVVIAKLRKEKKGKVETQTSKDRIAYVNELIPDFVWDATNEKFISSALRLKEFFNLYNRIPKYGGDKLNEKIIYGFYQRVR